MAYVDTSVLVAYYSPERLSPKAQKAMRRSGPPVISPLTEVEFYSALSLKVRTGELEEDSASRISSLLQLHIEDGRYGIVPVEAREYALACEWLGRFSVNLRTVDSLHLAAAFSNDLPLLTADKALAESAKRLGVKHNLVA